MIHLRPPTYWLDMKNEKRRSAVIGLAAVICSLITLLPAKNLRADHPFTISTSYNNLLSNPDKNGLLDQLMIELFKRVGIEMELVFTKTEKSLFDVNAGFFDGEINRIEGMEKSFPNLIRIPEANMTMHFVAFSKKSYQIDSWNSIRPLHIGLVKGWKILEQNTAGFPNVVRTPTEKELFTMLHKNRLDIALYAKLTGYAVLQQNGFSGIRHLEPPLASRPMYLYVHKSHERLVPVIADALKKMKGDGSYSKIMKE